MARETIVPLVAANGQHLRAFVSGKVVVFEVPTEARPWYVFDPARTWLAECPTLADARRIANEWNAEPVVAAGEETP
jgi:hypothetical protein